MKLSPSHLHILQSNGNLLAMVAVGDFSKRNVFKPIFFNHRKKFAKTIGAWLSPIMADLFTDSRPLFVLDGFGAEFEVDKAATDQLFFY